ncbi:ribose-5-phosphate isomerase [Halobacillus karajensis]|uniref:ribose 5-phosphate isomerase A n=1 Tax=Halobacillus karajensis TaxID=195088 RepID=UPI0008A7609C|nr:ribose 5-phosphate isomerase A [Halobacillus karajensis]SEH48039.1 ribose-5-phosphate isomerase [Halobacillus karajensis]
MKWKNKLAGQPIWEGPISFRDKKEKVAEHVSRFVRDGDIIGIGSGSTSFLALKKIAERAAAERWNVLAIPTSKEAEMNCNYYGLTTTSLLNARPDWGFDGADEVDSHNRLIKGRGGALFAEKLVMASSPKTYILVDESKLVGHLGEKFAVPLEVDSRSIHIVEAALKDMGIDQVDLRMAVAKDGPVITEAGNVIMDAWFPTISNNLEKELSAIPGVIESGLFIGYSVEILTV